MARISRFSDNRDQILRALAEHERRHKKPPSIRDLAEDAQVGVATMHSYLTKLAEEEMVEWRAGKHRSLHLTPNGRQRLTSLGHP